MSNISGFIKRLRDIMRNDAGINGDAQRIEQIAWLLFLRSMTLRSRTGNLKMKNICLLFPSLAVGEIGRTRKAEKE